MVCSLCKTHPLIMTAPPHLGHTDYQTNTLTLVTFSCRFSNDDFASGFAVLVLFPPKMSSMSSPSLSPERLKVTFLCDDLDWLPSSSLANGKQKHAGMDPYSTKCVSPTHYVILITLTHHHPPLHHHNHLPRHQILLHLPPGFHHRHLTGHLL